MQFTRSKSNSSFNELHTTRWHWFVQLLNDLQTECNEAGQDSHHECQTHNSVYPIIHYKNASVINPSLVARRTHFAIVASSSCCEKNWTPLRVIRFVSLPPWLPLSSSDGFHVKVLNDLHEFSSFVSAAVDIAKLFHWHAVRLKVIALPSESWTVFLCIRLLFQSSMLYTLTPPVTSDTTVSASLQYCVALAASPRANASADFWAASFTALSPASSISDWTDSWTYKLNAENCSNYIGQMHPTSIVTGICFFICLTDFSMYNPAKLSIAQLKEV